MVSDGASGAPSLRTSWKANAGVFTMPQEEMAVCSIILCSFLTLSVKAASIWEVLLIDSCSQ
jgi:hypothetical protein